MEYLHILKDDGDHHYVDVSHLLCDSMGIVKDFCSPIPKNRLESLYHEINQTNEEVKQVALPVRTMTMRLAPHVMTAVILDVVQKACRSQSVYTAQVLKRMLGHFQCLLIPTEDDTEEVPFLVDVRICTHKTGVLDRELLLRIFYAADHTPAKQQTAKQIRAEVIQNIHSQNLVIPINLHLRGASSFLQYLSKRVSGLSPMAVACPKDSPKACTAFFMGSFEPTSSVNIVNDPSRVQPNQMYPSLNAEDWTLLQSTWPLISTIWRGLTEANCLFHATKGPTIVLDLHYCSQIRQISRDNMLVELTQSFQDLQANLLRMERSYQVSWKVCQHACQKYSMPKIVESTNPSPLLSEPSSVPPVGYVKIAEIIYRSVPVKENQTVASACDQVVGNIYKTFCSIDERDGRKYLQDTNAIVMARLVEIQNAQQEMIQFIERHPNTETVAKQFAKTARLATNTKGRVARLLLARVPLMEFDLINGKCQITASNILCCHDRLMGQEWILVDVQAIEFQMISLNCLAILTKSRETIVKLHTSTDIPSLMVFIKTLQTLQTVLDLAGNYYISSNESEATNETDKDRDSDKGDVKQNASFTEKVT